MRHLRNGVVVGVLFTIAVGALGGAIAPIPTPARVTLGAIGAVVLLVGALALWSLIRHQAPSDTLAQVRASEELAARNESDLLRQERETAAAQSEQIRLSQLNDIELTRRALVLELRSSGAPTITFGWGDGYQRDGRRRTYRLRGDSLRGSLCAPSGSGAKWASFEWPKDGIPYNRDEAGGRSLDEAIKDANYVARLFGELRYERLLVPRNLPDEELRYDG